MSTKRRNAAPSARSGRQGAHSTPRIPSDNASLAAAAERVAALLQSEGGVDGRARTWHEVARAIRTSPRPIVELVEELGVEGVHRLGIDYVTGGMVSDLVRTGRLPLLERLEARCACGTVFERVPGIGPKLAREVREVLGVESLDGLARAAQDGTLSGICGFGPRRIRLVASLLAPLERRVRDQGPAGQLDLWASP